ncbi:FimD/PapC C-terminal domain-containing protein, partial [Escherichia coli]|uniref:FimD/PapC C-terminal domain-containing protein n=1 Tax=Escherichia coli TaxID=562 RepID=UPI003119CA8B
DRNRSHWSTSKTPSYTKSVSWQHHQARVGIKLLMTLTHNNKPLPFGAMVTSESSQSSGIVADNGQVYLSGMPLAGKVQVKWGEEENAHCVANYQLPPESQQQLLTQLSAECR